MKYIFIVILVFSFTIAFIVSNKLHSRSNLTTIVSKAQEKIIDDKIPGRYIVKFKTSVDITTFSENQTNSIVTSKLPNLNIQSVHVLSRVPTSPLYNTTVLTFPRNSDQKAILNTLKAQDFIEYVEPDYLLQLFAVPNDEFFSNQWHLQNTGQNGGIPGVDIQAVKAWDITTGNKNVIVAVIDTGIDNHPDIDDNLWTNKAETINNIDDDNNGYIDDIHGIAVGEQNHAIIADTGFIFKGGHGTSVASTLGSISNNKIGVAGLMPSISIMEIKTKPNEPFQNYLMSSLVEGIDYAINNGARVINISMGSGAESHTLKNLVNYAEEKNVFIVASAGNENKDYPFYPAAYDTVVAAASTNYKDEKSSFSQYGNWIDIAAPGEDIFTAYSRPNVPYEYRSGTSLASPLVAGLAGLIISKQPNLKTQEIRNIIYNSAKDLGTPGKDIYFGYGRIDAFKALSEMNTKLSENITPVQPKYDYTWRLVLTARCKNGGLPNPPTMKTMTETWYVVWPPNPFNPVHGTELKQGQHLLVINSNNPTSNVYVGLRATDGKFLKTYRSPAHSAITYGTAFNPPTPLAYWRSPALPSILSEYERYNIDFSAPESWCN